MSYTILYPIPSLKIGGAEQQLLELVRALDKSRFHPIVATLYGSGPLEGEFQALPGVELVSLGRQGKWDFSPIWQLWRLLRSRHVDVVQPWLPPATSFGILAGLLAGTPARIISERSGDRRTLDLYLRLQDRVSRFAHRIITNSEAGRDSLIRRGIPAGKIVIIENGINRDRLNVDQEIVRGFRTRLGVPDGGKVAGILASLTPVKHHADLLRAAALLKESLPELRLAIYGDGPLRTELEALTGEFGLSDRVVFFGNQRCVAECLSACDVLVSCSDREGLSNAILEAMALNVPVVGTDIPGTRELVQDGGTGSLVPVGDPQALAGAIARVFAQSVESAAQVERAHAMVTTRFGLDRMVAEHEVLYATLLGPRGRQVSRVGA